MFCKNCGNEIADIAAYCPKCGTPAQAQHQNSSAFGGASMSKKEYFSSTFCSDKAKKYITANWILFAVIAVVAVYTIVTTALGVGVIFSEVDFDQGFAAFIEQMEELSGESLGMTEEDMAMFEEFESLEAEMGFSMTSFITTVVYITIAVMLVFSALTVVFALLAVIKKSTGLAVTTLVFAVMFGNSFIIMGVSVALLVLTIQLNKEYKEYQSGGVFFSASSQGSYNEPNFGA